MNYFYADKTTVKTDTKTMKVVDGETEVVVDGETKKVPIYKDVVETTKTVMLGTKGFKGVDYGVALHCCDENDAVPIATSYDDLADKAPDIYEQMVWTQVGDEMILMVDWKKNGKPAHRPWFPRHVWFGVDPGFTQERAEEQAKKEKKG